MMDCKDDIIDVHTVTSFRVLPYSLTKEQPSIKPFKVPAHALSMFQEWMDKHNFPKPPPEHSPSMASQALFTFLSGKQHKLFLNLKPTKPTITVEFRVVLPNSAPAIIHPRSDALRIILWHLTRFKEERPLCLASCGFPCDSSCGPAEDKKSFHLSRVFKAASTNPVPKKRPRKPNCQLLNLPDDVLLNVVLRLKPTDFVALSNAHPYLREFLLPIVPGLRLRLFPHQIDALSRMAVMEKPRDQPFPLLESLETRNIGHIVADLVDGSLLLLENIPKVKLPIGGLFCDEPGLGKTITALSLVLRTAGKTPKPPMNREAWPYTASDGREIFAYRDDQVCRLSLYGKTPDDFPSRGSRLLPDLVLPSSRRSSRHVRVPDFFSPTKGLGSVPVAEEAGEIYLSRGTLILVPPVLANHWCSQIEQHVESEFLKVLHIRSRRDLPMDGIELATYDIVLLSFELLAELYEDVRRGDIRILQIHFLRVIIDEGHNLSSTSITKFRSVCERIRAEVRWVMTGTPTPATPRSDVDCLQALLTFIHDEAYGLDKEAWRVGIQDPYSNYKKESVERLSELLGTIMIRSDKSILKANCHVKNIFLDFSEESAYSYNGLVRMVRRNLITSDWFDDKHEESLLNQKNFLQAQALMVNLRKACCFGGTMDVRFNRTDVVATLEELYTEYRSKAGLRESDRFRDPTMEEHFLSLSCGMDEVEERRLQDIRRRADLFRSLDTPPLRLSASVTEDGITKSIRMVYSGKLQRIADSLLYSSCYCAKCGTDTKYPLVTPCGHLLCDECVNASKFACPLPNCGVRYRLDENDVPEDLIELQPSIQSHKWREDWAETDSSKMTYLIKRIESLPLNEEWRPYESSPRLTRPKVIVHSEYGDHLKLVALHMKTSEKLCDAYIEMVVNTQERHEDTKKFRRASQYASYSVKKFTEDPQTQVLLMNTRHGGVGLDLSFVQYIFLLEPVWDAAQELQIISRAHRIGCKSDIYVERLLMKDSVEQTMVEDLQTSVNRLDESGMVGQAQAKWEKDHQKVKNIFRRLKTVNFKTADEDIQEEAPINKDSRAVVGDRRWTGNHGFENWSDSVPGSSELSSLESQPPSLVGSHVLQGVLKRRRTDRDNSSEPRRVRFRQ